MSKSDSHPACSDSPHPVADSITQRRLNSYNRLFELYDQVAGHTDIPSVLTQCAEIVRSACHADRATIYLFRKETAELESAAVIGNVTRTIKVPIRRDSLAGFCALTARTFVVPDAYGDLSEIDPDLKFDNSWDRLNNYHTRDVMCAPAIVKDELLGVIQVINSRQGAFSTHDLIPLESISRFVAYTLYHARLYDELATMKGLEKQKAQFMRIMVHELRAPVAGAKFLISAQKFANRENPELIPVLDRFEQRMDQLLSLVEDILHLSRIKSGEPLGEIDVCDLVTHTDTKCQPYVEQAKAKGLSMNVDLPDSPVPVRIDVQGYHLILSNLVSNAVKYTPAGQVEVRLRADGSWARLEIRDTGMGVPEADISKLFTEFFRASNAKKSEIKGTGVGLAGVKQLVERFGGQLELRSQENEGSTFTIRLPLYEFDSSVSTSNRS